MEIILRNGEKIKLDWNPLVLEYLEDYDGGIEQLKKDIDGKNSTFRTFNFIIYCILSAVYPEELGYREAVSLVDINDLDRIVAFVVENVNDMKKANIKTKDNNTKITNIKTHRR